MGGRGMMFLDAWIIEGLGWMFVGTMVILAVMYWVDRD
jgi:hypothetical protein